MLRFDCVSFPNPGQLFYPVDHPSAWILPRCFLFGASVIQLLSLLPFFQRGYSSVIWANLHPWLGAFMHLETVACHWMVSASKVLLQRVKFALGLWSRLQSVYQLLNSNCLTCSAPPAFHFCTWSNCFVVSKQNGETVLVHEASTCANSFLFSPSFSVSYCLAFQV